jgi:hypothetical protein
LRKRAFTNGYPVNLNPNNKSLFEPVKTGLEKYYKLKHDDFVLHN